MAPPLKPSFGKQEKSNPLKVVLAWMFIAIGIGGIIWMIAVNPKQKKLICDNTHSVSLIEIGSCREE